MPDAYNPWGAPVFPTADDNAMQPEHGRIGDLLPQGNHDLIDIMRKYAVPGMLGAPILANALSEQKT